MDQVGFEEIFTQNPFFQNPEEFMRNAQNNGAHIHTSFSNNTSNNFNVYNNHGNPRNMYSYQQGYPHQQGYQNPHANSQFHGQEEYSDQEHRRKESSGDQDMNRNALKFNRQGNDYYKKMKFRKALECYELGLDIQKHWKLYKNMAWCYKRLGLFKESLKYIKKSIQLRPDDNLLYRLGGLFCFGLFTNSENIMHGKQMQDFFRKAYEYETNEINYFNYMLSRKVVYLFEQKVELEERRELFDYMFDNQDVQSQLSYTPDFDQEQTDLLQNFFTKNFYEKNPVVPEHFKGKISLEIMRYPYLTLSGVTYERDYIIRSIEENGYKDPTTNKEFHTENCLIYNTHLKKNIKDFMRKNKWGFQGDDKIKDWKLFEFK
jgi:tetratricopeptide (TPR) repeat protein